MSKVRKAVITAAGRGTRMYPATTTIQKEMLPIMDRDGICKPAIQIIIEEALDSGIDEHCARARAAGAVILKEPEMQFYGDRTYRAADLEGHIWTFGQTVKIMTPAEWDAASGLITKERLDP